MTDKLVFLKLGGSLITVKNQAHTPRQEILDQAAQEIAQALEEDPDLHILLGHGSGSYGHVAASQYHTRQGVRTAREWQGFSEVWKQAAELNQLVMAALEKAHLASIVYPPSASAIARDGKVAVWEAEPIRAALAKGLLPVVYGDVAYDQVRGGTILSTEDLFSHLAPLLQPGHILLAGREPGVWADYPSNSRIWKEITPANFQQVEPSLRGSSATDVTGGMLDKVGQMISLIAEVPGLQGMIFSGEVPGNVRRALLGEVLGSVIHAS